MSSPSKRIAPAVGTSCNRISFEVVVLPQPDSPMTPKVSPRSIAKSMPSTALTQPILRRGNDAVLTAKCLVRPSSSKSGGMRFLCVLDGERLGENAARRPRRGDAHLRGLVVGAARQCLRAARVKGAARWQPRQIGRLAGNGEELALVAELRHRADQRL